MSRSPMRALARALLTTLVLVLLHAALAYRLAAADAIDRATTGHVTEVAVLLLVLLPVRVLLFFAVPAWIASGLLRLMLGAAVRARRSS